MSELDVKKHLKGVRSRMYYKTVFDLPWLFRQERWNGFKDSTSVYVTIELQQTDE